LVSQPIHALAMSQDGKWLVLAGGPEPNYRRQPPPYEIDGVCQLWDLTTAKKLRDFSGHKGDIRSVALSRDERYLVSGARDGSARLWEVATGKEIKRFQGHNVNSVALSQDGKWLATGGIGGIEQSFKASVKIWDLSSGKEVYSTEADGQLACVSFSKDGKWLAAGSQEKVLLVEVTSKKVANKFTTFRSDCLAFSDDNKWLVTGDGLKEFEFGFGTKTACIWEAATGKQVRVFEKQTISVSSVVLSGDGKWLVTTGSNPGLSAVRLWDLASGKQLVLQHGWGQYSPPALSRDGKRVATTGGGGGDNSARVWEAAASKQLCVVKGDWGNGNTISLTGDGKRLVTSAETINGNNIVQMWDASTGKPIQGYLGKRPTVQAAVISEDGRFVATASGDTIQLWEAETGKELSSFQWYGNRHLTFSRDGKWLLVGNGLFDVPSGRKLLQLKGYKGEINSVAISSNRKWLVTAHRSEIVNLWDAKTGDKVRSFKGISAAISPDGKTLYTGGHDQVTCLWNTDTGKELCRLISYRDGTWAVVDSEGKYDSANNGDVIGLRMVLEEKTIPLDQLKKQYYTPGLLARYWNDPQLKPAP
jgi:WD40 repeat protein